MQLMACIGMQLARVKPCGLGKSVSPGAAQLGGFAGQKHLRPLGRSRQFKSHHLSLRIRERLAAAQVLLSQVRFQCNRLLGKPIDGKAEPKTKGKARDVVVGLGDLLDKKPVIALTVGNAGTHQLTTPPAEG